MAAPWAIAALALLVSLAAPAQVETTPSPLRTEHFDQIRALLSRYGLPKARVELDRYGRVALKGEYEDREEVEIAHSIVQSVVGVRWTSMVTPENVRVTNLQKGAQSALGDLFAKVKPGAGSQGQGRGAAVDPAPGDDQAPGPIRRRFAMVLGVGEFNQQGVKPLEYAAGDARTFHAFLTDPAAGRFSAADAQLLVNERATSRNVLAWLDRVEAQAQPDDLVVFYASTHGSSPDSEGLMAVITHDTVIDRPTASQLRKTSVPGARLAQFVQNVKARRLIIILDTCYSSAAFGDVPGYASRSTLWPSGRDEVYGVRREAVVRMTGGKNLVREDDLQAQPPTAPGAKDGWGRVLITASGPDEKSWESRNLKASFFTHYFVRGLRATGNIRDAFAYSRRVVPGEVLLEKQAQQTPNVFSTNAHWAMGF